MPDDPAGDRSPFALRDYLGVLLRRSWIVLIVTGIVFGVGYHRSERQTRVYQAQGQLELTGLTKDGDLQTQMRVVESPVVHDAAARTTKGIGQASAQQAGLGNIITVSSTSTDPQQAARTVNATIDAYTAYVKAQGAEQVAATSAAIQGRLGDLQRQINNLQSQLDAATTAAPSVQSALTARRDALITEQSTIQQSLDSLRFNVASAGTGINVVARAVPPTKPIRPNPRQDGLVALGAGLLLGLVLAFFIEYLVRSSRTNRQDVVLQEARAEPTVMRAIPASRAANGVAPLSAPVSGPAVSYQSPSEAAALMGLGRGRCIEVTSAPDRDGKTETLFNLAVLLARGGRRVVVVDCDLRAPRVHELFGLRNETGFTSVMGGSSLPDALQQVPNVDHLYALTAGPLPADPEAMLGSSRCGAVLNSLLAGGTLVLIDTAPFAAPVTDALTLARSVVVDDVVIVARTKDSEYLRRALDAFQHTAVQQVGVVITATGAGTVTGGTVTGGSVTATDDPPVKTVRRALLALRRNGHAETPTGLTRTGR